MKLDIIPISRRLAQRMTRALPALLVSFCGVVLVAVSTFHPLSLGLQVPPVVSSSNADTSIEKKILGNELKTRSKRYAYETAALYHQARTDRSGSVIHDMLLAHAYAFQQNRSYGGACSNTSLPYLDEHHAMIEILGLSHVLKFACPPFERSHEVTNDNMLTNRYLYTRFGTRLWTSVWLDHIRSMQYGLRANAPSERKSVVVHIRRGDVSLCDPSTFDRYLPNLHYLTLLEQYGISGSDITIFSESQSVESWNDFRGGKSFDLRLDRSSAEAWLAMMGADVLIMSKSSFSVVPAVFNRRGLIVYTPFWVEPMAHWEVIDADTFRATQRNELRLKSHVCEPIKDAETRPLQQPVF